MRAATHATVLAIAGSTSACIFGSGPQPTPPSEAKVVLATPSVPQGQECTQSTYISAVDIAGPTGYAVFLPYAPNMSNCGGPPPQQGISVVQFDSSGNGNVHGMMVQNGQLGQSNTGPAVPHITIGSSGPRWTFNNSGQVTIGPVGAFVNNLGSFQSGNVNAVGLASAGSSVYLALENFGNNGCSNDPASPDFPSSGGCGPSGGTSGLFVVTEPLPMQMSVMATQIPISNNFFFDQTFDVIASNSTSVFFFVHTNNQGAAILTAANGAATSSQVDTMPTSGDSGVPPNVTPVGIDADDTRVVWAGALPVQQGVQTVQPGCFIWSHDLTSNTTHLIFHTHQLACLGARIDNGFVYFAIVRTETTDCNSCTPPIHGDGLGRVSLSPSPAFESIAAGFSGYAAGPRRVYVDYGGSAVWAVDPNAIGRIDKMSFQNRHDFQVEADATMPLP